MRKEGGSCRYLVSRNSSLQNALMAISSQLSDVKKLTRERGVHCGAVAIGGYCRLCSTGDSCCNTHSTQQQSPGEELPAGQVSFAGQLPKPLLTGRLLCWSKG